MEKMYIYLPIAMAVLGLLFMGIKAAWINKQDAGDERMQEIAKSIQEGAMAFLKAEYRFLELSFQHLLETSGCELLQNPTYAQHKPPKQVCLKL
jgi:Na+/H+-translocating membrane pyrophosphatase